MSRVSTSEETQAWADSGCMSLTGQSDGSPLVAPDGVVAAIRRIGAAAGVDGLQMLTERAALLGLGRQGAVSCGGGTRLVRAQDGGWVAVCLARPDDVALVPAWLEGDVLVGGEADEACWSTVASAVAVRTADQVVERARLLGLAVSRLGQVRPQVAGDTPPVIKHWLGTAGGLVRTPLVIDLSSLWAGPLASRLLAADGARVIKVESINRPDGARRGHPAFFDLMNAGKEAVTFDFGQPQDVDRLRRLLDAADVVIEATRPRALEQLGIDARAMVERESGPRVWVSITGYGREGPMRDWVAFGDDAAVAGGLVTGDPCFVADAVADPLTGMVAAAAVQDALSGGGRWLLDVSLAQVAASVSEAAGGQAWGPAHDLRALAPVVPELAERGPELGEHTESVLTELVR